jgi:hypothetical protein
LDHLLLVLAFIKGTKTDTTRHLFSIYHIIDNKVNMGFKTVEKLETPFVPLIRGIKPQSVIVRRVPSLDKGRVREGF